MRKVIFTIIVAAVLWTIMFCPLTAGYVNFWWMMTFSALTLSALATCFQPQWIKNLQFNSANLFYGVLIAVALWGVFWIGDKISSMLFNFARGQVDLIYGMKEGESAWLLTVLMLFIIGPAEEIFWRGYVQKRLSEHYSPNKGFIITTIIYAAVHLGACNFMLFAAAGVAGLVWGIIYRFYPDKLLALIISHTLWDVAVFIWFPI
ncbi:MAG: type II CAAX endopeptidase family protein [Bacteroidia bacterium]|nr:type II CAAX endopeptidase family protein [Bacteroidia bacterium]